MAPDAKKKGRPKKTKEATVNCRDCNAELGDYDDAMDCDLCKEYTCLKCTGFSEEVLDFLKEKDVAMPFICTPCKADLPKIRELMGLKQKYENLQGEVTKLREELQTQELKFQNQEANMTTLSDRLKTLEDKTKDEDLATRLQVIENRPNNENFPNLLDANLPNQPQQFRQFVDQVRPVIINEIRRVRQNPSY